jgi:hypothetical protein
MGFGCFVWLCLVMFGYGWLCLVIAVAAFRENKHARMTYIF